MDKKVIMGIYQIRNVISNKIYIGSSKDIYKRWKQHKTLLKSNRHHSPYLQNAWNKDGDKNFEFTILQVVDDENQLLDIEQEWLDKTKCYNQEIGYNINTKTKGLNIEDILSFRKEKNKQKEKNDTFKFNINYAIEPRANYEDNYQKEDYIIFLKEIIQYYQDNTSNDISNCIFYTSDFIYDIRYISNNEELLNKIKNDTKFLEKVETVRISRSEDYIIDKSTYLKHYLCFSKQNYDVLVIVSKHDVFNVPLSENGIILKQFNNVEVKKQKIIRDKLVSVY
jgi:group I intron endonuclease